MLKEFCDKCLNYHETGNCPTDAAPEVNTEKEPPARFSIMQAVQLRGQHCERGKRMRGLIIGAHYSPNIQAWMYDIEWQDDTTSMFEFDLEPATL